MDYTNKLAEFGLKYAMDFWQKIERGELVEGIHSIDDWLASLDNDDLKKFNELMDRVMHDNDYSDPVGVSQSDYEGMDWCMVTMYAAMLEGHEHMTEEEVYKMTGMVFVSALVEELCRAGIVRRSGKLSLYNECKISLTDFGKFIGKAI